MPYLQHPMYKIVRIEVIPSVVAHDVAHVAPWSQVTKFAGAVTTKLEVRSDLLWVLGDGSHSKPHVSSCTCLLQSIPRMEGGGVIAAIRAIAP